MTIYLNYVKIYLSQLVENSSLNNKLYEHK